MLGRVSAHKVVPHCIVNGASNDVDYILFRPGEMATEDGKRN
jgi:hypothetical protein